MIVCLLVTSGYFSKLAATFGERLQEKVTAKAADDNNEGETKPERKEAILYNFAKLWYYDSDGKKTELKTLDNKEAFFRMNKTSILINKEGHPLDHPGYYGNGNNINVPTSDYEISPTQGEDLFTPILGTRKISTGQGMFHDGWNYVYVGKYTPNLQEAISAGDGFGDNIGYYQAEPEMSGAVDGAVLRIQYFRKKIGGTSGGWLYPNNWMNEGEPQDDALSSLHCDYRITLVDTAVQPVYNFIKAGNTRTYYRLQKQDQGIVVAPVAMFGNAKEINRELFPYDIADYDFSNFSGSNPDYNLVVNDKTYVYWDPEQQENPPEGVNFYTIDKENPRVEANDKLIHNSEDTWDDNWLDGADTDSWGNEIYIKAIHRNFQATLYDRTSKVTVNFVDGETTLDTVKVNCGSTPEYTKEEPVRDPSDVTYKFYGWEDTTTHTVYDKDSLPIALANVTYQAVFKVVLTVTARNASKDYDSTPLTNAEFTVTGYPADLAEADKPDFSVKMTDDSTITNVGNVPNVIDTVNDVSVSKEDAVLIGDYFVQTADGTLTVSPRKVTITAQDASQTYNGDPLTESGFDVDGLADEDTHEFTVVMTPESTITNVGIQPNVIATVDGVPVSTGVETKVGNYLVTTVNGTLEVLLSELEVKVTAAPSSGVVVGATINYTVEVTNSGNVAVKDGTLESNLADLSGKTFALAPGQKITFTYTYTVTQNDFDAGKIVDTVKVNATAERGENPEEAQATATVTAYDAVSLLSITKTADKTSGVKVGDSITYTVVVKNDGNVSVIHGTLEDNLVYLGDKRFELAPKKEATFTYTYTVTQADVDAGKITNYVSANAKAVRGENPGEVYNSATVTAEAANAELSITKSANPTSGVAVGDTITYTVVVTNTGNVSVTDGTLRDTLVDLSGKTFELAPGASAEFTYSYTVIQADVDAGKINNTVTANATAVRGDDPAVVSADAEVTTVAAAAELSVTKSADVTEDVKVGDTITYTVEVTNTGNVTVTDVALGDTMVTVEENGFSLAPGETKEISYKYTVTQADVDAGEIANTVTVSAAAARGDDPDDASATVTVAAEAAAAELSITKSVNESANAVNAGDTITYTVVVKNTGNVTVKDITLSDTLVTLDETFDLAPAETKTITYEYTVNNADVDAGVIENVVKANGMAVRGDDPEEVSATVTVLPGREALIIESETKSWTYDGETHTSEVYTVKYDGEEVQPDDETGKVFTLKTGDKLTITSNAAGVKDYDTEYLANNTFTYTIENETLYENVNTTFGTLSIDKRPVTLTSESDEKVYDGTALTKPDVTVEGDGFVDGEVNDLKANGSVTNVSDGHA